MTILDCLSHKGSRTMSMESGPERLERVHKSQIQLVKSEVKVQRYPFFISVKERDNSKYRFNFSSLCSLFILLIFTICIISRTSSLAELRSVKI